MSSYEKDCERPGAALSTTRRVLVLAQMFYLFFKVPDTIQTSDLSMSIIVADMWTNSKYKERGNSEAHKCHDLDSGSNLHFYPWCMVTLDLHNFCVMVAFHVTMKNLEATPNNETSAWLDYHHQTPRFNS